jgi:hypothetical protein
MNLRTTLMMMMAGQAAPTKLPTLDPAGNYPFESSPVCRCSRLLGEDEECPLFLSLSSCSFFLLFSLLRLTFFLSALMIWLILEMMTMVPVHAMMMMIEIEIDRYRLNISTCKVSFNARLSTLTGNPIFT